MDYQKYISKKVPDPIAKAAVAKRKNFLKHFKENGIHFASNNLSKPFLHKISPGCAACVNGTWSCIYINGLCTRSCFYCPQDRHRKDERRALAQEGLEFGSAAEYLAYLQHHHFEGIGFSGGEPFLVFDRLLAYITEIRRVLGKQHYIWVYTNGDPVTEARLRKLNDAGLDEIRFDLSAVNYDLKRIPLAVAHIDTVTVEIPAIPEDEKIVKALIPQLEELGVAYLNLHQLMVSENNWQAMADRDYTTVDRDLFDSDAPILQSELTACDILTHALKIKTRMGINYCSRLYKERFQQRGLRQRYARLIEKNDASITDTGYLRKFWIKGSADDIQSFVKRLPLGNVPGDPTQLENGESGCFVPPDLFLSMLKSDVFIRMDVIYFNPSLEKLHKGNHEKKRVITYGTNIRLLNAVQMCRFRLERRTDAMLFKKLFMEKKGRARSTREIKNAHRWGKKDPADTLSKVETFHQQFANMEYLPRDLPDYA